MSDASAVGEVTQNERALLLPHKVVESKKATPLPKLQFFILLFLQLCEPVVAACILPFINTLVRDLDITGGDDKKVGFYSGLLISLFFLTEAVFTLQWSRLSDHIGRRPVLMIGSVGLIMSMVFFGLSTTFWTLVISRCLAGILNGNAGVMKSMLTEITDSTNLAQAVAYMSVDWALGCSIGELIGGTLVNPARSLPGFDNAFWRQHPYALPPFVAALFPAIAVLLTIFLLKETLGRYRKPDNVSEDSEAQRRLASEAPLPLRSLFIYPVIISVANYASLGFIEIANIALLPLFYSTPIHHGGLGLDPMAIGLLLGIYSLVNGLLQVLFFARLVKKFGTKNIFVACVSCFIPIFLLYPAMNVLARRAGGLTPAVWVIMVLQLCICMYMDMAFGAIFMFVAKAAPNKRSLGAVNGLSQTTVSICRALSPAITSSLFALSLEHNLLGGYAVYLFLIVLACFSITLATRLPKEPWKRE